MMNNGQEIVIAADEGDGGGSLEDFIQRRLTWFPYDDLGEILRHYKFSIKGKPAAINTILQGGQNVDIFRKPWVEPKVPLDVELLFEDESLLVLDKPAGLPILPHGDFLENTLLHLFRKQYGSLLSPLHRLDMETSGVLLLAKDKEVRSWYQRQFQNRHVQKSYEALAHGLWAKERRTVEMALVRDSLIYSKFVPGAEGKLAQTNILEVIHQKGYSYLTLQPITGRTHQLRAHLAACGHSLVGDKKYHADPSVFFKWLESRDWCSLREELLLPHHALHCRTLGCWHHRGGWRQWRSRRPVWRDWWSALDGKDL